MQIWCKYVELLSAVVMQAFSQMKNIPLHPFVRPDFTTAFKFRLKLTTASQDQPFSCCDCFNNAQTWSHSECEDSAAPVALQKTTKKTKKTVVTILFF